ncbi:SMI1/KNR4 family protein [Undibacterium umbellatum]|uniref:SMI1/KNR4 family protein n=1 Tax=Undibacterium umbellatum TaxID=2762300 RepID=A0ABR6Z9D4_9BURK|nr:SMI1/KNR4 family protein [Undibacterium umbellatum]MBC3907921.1 SMI1/KNR4 family protein [Undibacterium umbellatum]
MINFKKWLEQAGLDEGTGILGISAKEIELIEQKYSIRLPKSYKDFLQQCGISAGLFSRDISFFYDDVLYMWDSFGEAVREWGVSFSLPENAFLFSEYQGGSYHYFICDGNDNPPIFAFSEANPVPIQISSGFVEYIKDSISAYQDMFYKNPDKRWFKES